MQTFWSMWKVASQPLIRIFAHLNLFSTLYLYIPSAMAKTQRTAVYNPIFHSLAIQVHLWTTEYPNKVKKNECLSAWPKPLQVSPGNIAESLKSTSLAATSNIPFQIPESVGRKVATQSVPEWFEIAIILMHMKAWTKSVPQGNIAVRSQMEKEIYGTL